MSKLRFQNRRMKWKKERKEERNRSAEISQVNILIFIFISDLFYLNLIELFFYLIINDKTIISSSLEQIIIYLYHNKLVNFNWNGYRYFLI